MNISQATSFLKQSLTTGRDFGGVDKGRAEAQRVDTELERISADTVDVKKGLSELDKNSALQPPSFKNVSNGQLIAATTSGGAVLGGAFGALRAVAAGPGTVSFNEVRHDIISPKLNGTGFDINVVSVNERDTSRFIGWDVDINRRPLVNEKVGEYTTREPVSSNTTSIALSGAIGLAVGAGIGAGVGLAAIGLRKALKQEYNGAPARETEGDTKVLITGGVAGAVVGAAAGAISALTQSTTVKYETQSVAYENKVIGKVPSGGGIFVPDNGKATVPANAEAVQKMMNGNLDKLARDGYRGLNNLSPEEVRADVPKRTIFGNIDIDTEKKEVKVGPSMLGSVVGGAAIGAVTGVAGGVLVNVLRKTL